jgi:hypothetical protein
MPADELFLTIDPDGTINFIYSDLLAELLDEGDAHVVRASNVEPAQDGPGWTADMTPRLGPGAPVLGPFPRHADAIAAEIAFLREDMATGPKRK